MKIFVSRLVAPEKRILEILEPNFEIKLGKPPFDEQVAIREIEDADGILVTTDFPVTRRVMESTSKLKVISKYGAGFENIDLKAATELGIIVTYSPVNFKSVAECAVLLMLGLLRNIPRLINYVKGGEWKTPIAPAELLGQELAGKTVGIIGFGRIGSHLAKILQGFEARVLAFDPYVSSDKAAEVGARMVDFEALLKMSDIVIIHCMLTSETLHLIGEKELKLMKPTAILINTSRGPIVDEKALHVALEKGWIAGAGLDVFEQEPPDVDNSLLKLDNVLATPHIAGVTVEAREKAVTQAAKNLVEVLVQGRLPSREFIANPKVLEAKMRTNLR